ncbi:MAG: FkbM family methyltransferase [Pirellulaceae bacterium]
MTRLCLHHVGGRAGNRSFPSVPALEKDIINVLYDADQDCIAQIESRNRSLESELHVLPYCVGGRSQPAVDCHINYDPYSSSVLQMNAKYADWYFYFRNSRYDYIVKDAFKTVETRSLPLHTLDDICEMHPDIAPPDLLSLDAQGLEYDILEGAPRVLRSHVLAVVTEVEFHPMYSKQKLFGDISALLSQRGFDFVKFTKGFGEYSPYRKSIGLRGDGFHCVGEALFFRSIDSLMNADDPAERTNMLDKLACFAIVYNQFEFAVECLERSMACRDSIGRDSTGRDSTGRDSTGRDSTGQGSTGQGLTSTEKPASVRAYHQLLRDIENELKTHKPHYPPVFSDFYTWQASKSRFDVDSDFRLDSPIQTTSTSPADSQMPIVAPADSRVEAILRKYDLAEQAEVLKLKRIEQAGAGNLP